MRVLRKNNKAFSILEYCVLLLLIMGALIVMRDSIFRAFSGRWKTAGDSLAFGRQYEPGKTTECVFSLTKADYGIWYDNECYVQKRTACAPGDLACEDIQKEACKQDYCCKYNTEEQGHSNCK